MEKEKLSSMMQHYMQVKEQYKDCFIFYRLGDFYELFFDDAVKVSSLLGLTLTGRACGLPDRAPMCGVPYHAVDGYISKLVSLGYKVAICEQLEEASSDKKGVARGVVRVVTAGTVTDDEAIDAQANSFISCACKIGEVVALCWADITTGELFATQFSGADNVKNCLSKMTVLEVKEVICNDEMLIASKNYPEVTRGVLPRFSSYPAWAFGYSSTERTLLEQFKAKTLSAFSIAEKREVICGLGALVEYLKETQMHALKNIDSVNFVAGESYMQLDSNAIRNLELVKNIGNNDKYGSLLWLFGKTKTSMGARMLTSVILNPLVKKEEINYRLDGVDELYAATVIRKEIRELLSSVKDIERISGKVSNGNLNPQDCTSLAESLLEIPNIKFKLSGFSAEILKDIDNNLIDLSGLGQLLERAIAPKAPTHLREGGVIADGFNAQLDELRNISKHADDIKIQMEADERERTGIKNLRIGNNNVFGYYIEVTKSFIDKVPLNYERRQTLANAERFTTPELRELEAKIVSSTELAIKLENEIYNKIKATLLDCIDKLKTIASAVALLDVIATFAEVAKSNRFVRPEIVDSDKPLSIKEGRHPVVEAISKDKFIPNDTYLDCGDNRTMILTGPNMAGKSTFMRQTAIITVMAHIGSFVPAKSAQIPICDRVFTRVGASDNLILDQSTFMVEMIEVATIIQNATKSSLLILDEVGRGTSTYDGLSIAWAVIEYITKNIGAKTMFATHYHELTELENTLDGVKNYKIAVRELNGTVVFLRKIMRGGANRSFGIEVASLAGIPADVTNRAKQILKRIESGDKKFETNFTEEREDQTETPKLSEVEKILAETDINALSPMQAFILVGDLIEKVKK